VVRETPDDIINVREDSPEKWVMSYFGVSSVLM
jgi:hypothetical protein